jgi:hypothetical protein
MNNVGYVLLVAAVYVLAVMRIVRLINFDTILDPVRLRIDRPAVVADAAAVEADAAGQSIIAELHRERSARWRKLQEFASCPWCVGMWVAFGTVWLPLYHADNPVVRYVGVGLAVSMIVGLLAPLSADEFDVIPDGKPEANSP